MAVYIRNDSTGVMFWVDDSHPAVKSHGYTVIADAVEGFVPSMLPASAGTQVEEVPEETKMLEKKRGRKTKV